MQIWLWTDWDTIFQLTRFTHVLRITVLPLLNCSQIRLLQHITACITGHGSCPAELPSQELMPRFQSYFIQKYFPDEQFIYYKVPCYSHVPASGKSDIAPKAYNFSSDSQRIVCVGIMWLTWCCHTAYFTGFPALCHCCCYLLCHFNRCCLKIQWWSIQSSRSK